MTDSESNSELSPYAGLASRIRKGKSASTIEFENRPPELTIIRGEQGQMGRGVGQKVLLAHRNVNASAEYRIFVDDNHVGEISQNARVTLKLEPGLHFVYLRSDLSLSNSMRLNLSNGDRVSLYCAAKLTGLILYR